MTAFGRPKTTMGTCASLQIRPGLLVLVPAPRARYGMRCLGPDGAPKWQAAFTNLVTDAGKDSLLDIMFDAATQVTTWYLGLVAGASPSFAAADTLASHAGWTEFTGYSGDRQAIGFAEPASQSLASAADVSFAITGAGTVGGAFVCSVATGTAGILYSEGDLDADRTVASGDTLNVAVSLSA
jgi:hypothetical protein